MVKVEQEEQVRSDHLRASAEVNPGVDFIRIFDVRPRVQEMLDDLGDQSRNKEIQKKQELEDARK